MLAVLHCAKFRPYVAERNFVLASQARTKLTRSAPYVSIADAFILATGCLDLRCAALFPRAMLTPMVATQAHWHPKPSAIVSRRPAQ